VISFLITLKNKVIFLLKILENLFDTLFFFYKQKLLNTMSSKAKGNGKDKKKG